MNNVPALAAIDWGTRRLRIWLMSRTGAVLEDDACDEGIENTQGRAFADILTDRLDRLGAPPDLPALICGMIGSRHGWVEAGYIDTPADLDRLPDQAIRVPGVSRPIRILPGIAHRSADEPDVMRGEETQLFGAVLEGHGAGLYCLPGRRSKWVTMEGAKVRNFRTFMTGEFDAVLTEATILRHSVDGEAEVSADDPAFMTGVRDGWLNAPRVFHLLFSIRGAHLLHGATPRASRARLSGLLIGAELAGAEVGGQAVALVASGPRARLYGAALETCGATVRLIDADIAVQRGLYEAWRVMESQYQ